MLNQPLHVSHATLLRLADCEPRSSRVVDFVEAGGDMHATIERELRDRVEKSKHCNTKFVLPLSMPFVFLHDGKLCKTVVKCTLPAGRPKSMRDAQCDFDWAVYNELEPRNAYRFTPDWLASQIQTFRGLSDDDLHTIMTYMYDGDMAANAHLLHQAGMVNKGFFISFFPGKHWYMKQKLWGHHELLLFGPQIERLLGTKQMQPPADVHKVAAMKDKLSREDMGTVLDMFVGDLLRIFRKCPRLTSPMVLYRGEQDSNEHLEYKNLHLNQTSATRFTSFTLDASSASYFARKHTDTRGIQGSGRVYRVLFPVGTPILFVAGAQSGWDIFECECLLPPVYTITETGHHTFGTSGTRIVDAVAHLTDPNQYLQHISPSSESPGTA